MTSTELWPRLADLVDRALLLDPAARVAFLERECQACPELFEEARSLVELETTQLDRLRRITPLPDTVAGSLVESISESLDRPATIGEYRVLSTIGRGGMATVFLATPLDESDPRRVAIKRLHRGFEGLDIEQRFDREGEILQRFRHPHIAALYGSGRDAEGRPFLVMEAIEGEPIDQYCDRQELDLDQVLELFHAVCRAVAYAHRNLVVHRDLKPSNLLVTKSGEPKLVDFGISKLLDPDSLLPLTRTRPGRQAMTPQYASPEQVRGEPATTSCDVYGLGVVLFELLTGRRPFTGSAETLLHQVLDAAPPRPSRTETRRFDPRRLRGDLDTIVLTALEKDPHLRYASIDQFAADIERHRNDLPVQARPARWSYRLRKFLRRQRRLVAAVAVVGLLVVALVWQREQSRSQIRQERDRALAAQEHLVSIFDQADPLLGHGASFDGRLDIESLLGQSAVRIAHLDDQPELQSDLARILGRVYLNLGALDSARPLLEQAFRLESAQHGDDSIEAAEILALQGRLLHESGEFVAALDRLETALAIQRASSPVDRLAEANLLKSLAWAHLMRRHMIEAAAFAHQSYRLRESVWGRESLRYADGANTLGSILLLLEAPQTERIEDLFTEALRIRRRSLDAQHPDLANSLNNLATIQSRRADFAAARDTLEEALEMSRRSFGPEHRAPLTMELNLAVLDSRRGDFDQAIVRLRDLVPRMRKHLPPESFLTRQAGRLLAQIEQQAAEQQTRQSASARAPASDAPPASPAPRSRPSDP